jgi:hypothetical protein
VAVGVVHDHRACRVEGVERLLCDHRSLEVRLLGVPVLDLEPGVGLVISVLVEASLDAVLEPGDAERE